MELPFGVEKSEWTLLDVTLLGSRKRIIQIETQFTETPHLIQSYACPATSPNSPSDVSSQNWKDVTPSFRMDQAIPLLLNETVTFSQFANTNLTFSYAIQGYQMTSCFLVRQSNFEYLFLIIFISRYKSPLLLVIQIYMWC